ncbi:hypothetical protein BDV25DRAFT_147482 [Aspergillus avenaceus]|uniref:Ubiquitin 3 binding protein But2 C-terminal domain-containing protein n=1 Tax=Aspergillus avenaceus TaxID=36643 RepID=A0A5N6U7D9_ASPAV|nr:hypothetical protein BDV25DRAFT_147482 [Aspergillus avenaceus]
MKSVVTFHPFTGESICQLAIEFPAMPEAQYARGDTVMQVWVVDHMENPTWNNQPRKRMRLDTTTFPTWQVEQGWTQRFATLECKETMSFMVELSSTRDGDVAFWNKLMGKQGAPPIGWRMLHGC